MRKLLFKNLVRRTLTEPRPPADWKPSPKLPSPPPRPLMPPFEHASREPRLYAAAQANDTQSLQDITNCPWDWHHDELIRAAGLGESLSPTRQGGLANILARMQAQAARHVSQDASR